MARKKRTYEAEQFQTFSDKAEGELGLERATVSIWVKPKDKTRCRDAMRKAGSKYRQNTATIRSSKYS